MVRPTDVLTTFISTTPFDALPSDGIELAKLAILDTVGVLFGGVQTKEGALITEWARRQNAGGAVPVFGAGLRSSSAIAAMANSVLAAALDYDDGNHPAYGHPSCILVPTLLAVGETPGISGRDLLLAYMIGFEFEARLGATMNPSHFRRGFHATSTLGTLAGAAAASRALRLSRGETAHALGIAASFAGGIKQNLGTMMKPFHAGHASHSAVVSAEFAGLGLQSDAEALEGRAGFLNVFRGAEEPNMRALTDGLADSWYITTAPSGWYPKPFASCGGTHTTIQGLLQMKEQHGFKADEIGDIGVAIARRTAETLMRHNPQSGREARYSLEFCAAHTLLFGAPNVADFGGDEKVQDRRVRSLMARVAVSSPPEVADDPEPGVILTVTLADGTKLTHAEPTARGKVGNRMPRHEMLTKFDECSQHALPGPVRRRVIDMIDNLEALRDIRRLTSQLATPSR